MRSMLDTYLENFADSNSTDVEIQITLNALEKLA